MCSLANACDLGSRALPNCECFKIKLSKLSLIKLLKLDIEAEFDVTIFDTSETAKLKRWHASSPRL